MKKPILVIMAAGMGSRYGGLKQIDPVDTKGHIIMDFSIYDAIKAGFEKVVFIIKREDEMNFRGAIGDRIKKHIQVAYVFQEINYFLKDFPLPNGRKKPWGTAHAILCCWELIDGPFVVINADDYYGRSAFQAIYNFLSENQNRNNNKYAMVGYELENTLTDHGYVARGICQIGKSDNLIKIIERTHIEKRDQGPAYTEDGENWIPLPLETIVSMNMWGFQKSIIEELEQGFALFLKEEAVKNPLTCEYFLPNAVGKMLDEENAVVDVLKSQDKWYGMTYKEDKISIIEVIEQFKRDGIYPDHFLEG